MTVVGLLKRTTVTTTNSGLREEPKSFLSGGGTMKTVKRKTRSDKFPLTLHPSGQYCKKIKGKMYYFGSDKKEALQRYLEGNDKYATLDSISTKFIRLVKKSGLDVPKGTGFYGLRRTAATIAARSGDPFAVQRLLGHADLKMATRYVQDVSKQTDRVIENSRKHVV